MAESEMRQEEIPGGAQNVTNVAPQGSYYEAFQDAELKTYAAEKGWKSPEDVVANARGMEKLLGVPKDHLVRWPDKADAPEWGEIYKRLGVPEAPDKYDFPVDPEFRNDEYLAFMRNALHEAKIPASAAKFMVEKQNEFVRSFAEAQAKQMAEQAQAQQAELQREWGSEYPRLNTQAERAAARIGLKQEEFKAIEAAIGVTAARKAFANLGSRMAENPNAAESMWNDEGANSWTMTPEAAAARVKQLRNDKDFGQRVMKGDRNAIEEMHRLSRIAAAGQ